MRIKRSALALAIALTVGASVANASEIYSVTATYDDSFISNTFITVKNLSSVAETNVNITSGGFTETLGTIAAGASATYEFNENIGPFITDPGDKGQSDATTYQVNATFNGTTVSSALFSPVSNLTGGYVDFLGSCDRVENGCLETDPTVFPPLTGVVADGVAPVPLPPSFFLLLSGVAALGVRGIRRASKSTI